MNHKHDWRWVEHHNLGIKPKEADGKYQQVGLFVCRRCPAAKWARVEWRDGSYWMGKDDKAP